MSEISVAVKHVFRQPAFVVAVVVLGLCAAVLNAAMSVLHVVPIKGRVDLAANLREGIPQQLGHWTMISTDHSIDPEIQAVLGTPEYVFRDYVDDRKVSPDDIARLKSAAPVDRELLVSRIQSTNPTAVIRVAVTYYTGQVDTVAHVPERCYVADGFDVTQHQTRHAVLGKYSDGKPRAIDYSYLSFEDQTGLGRRTQRVARNVGYVFHCDGEYVSSANGVRWKLQSFFEHYAYYAKVEMMTVGQSESSTSASGAEDSPAAMEDFLCQALPEIEKCFGNWQTLHKK